MIVRRDKCLLCKAPLEPTEDGYQRHPDVEDCRVRVTDEWGIALTDDQIAALEAGYEDDDVKSPASPLQAFMGGELDGLLLQQFPTVDSVLIKIFDEAGVPRLGGQSTGRGWSSFAVMQRCWYAWKKRYLEQATPISFTERESLAVGTLIHTFLALHYAGMMEDSPYAQLTPERVFERLLNEANPSFVNEGWRVFKAYRLYYSLETIIPLAIEHDLKDPRTGESCRYDLIAYVPEDTPTLLAGTYEVEHKSSGRFDMNTLDGWANDGEVIGQVALWKRLGLEHRFGPLRGAIVNILGKQKEPKFHRTIVAPESWAIESHFDDLRRWEAMAQVAKATNNFPRSRANCIGRWGRCDWWDHCATGEG